MSRAPFVDEINFSMILTVTNMHLVMLVVNVVIFVRVHVTVMIVMLCDCKFFDTFIIHQCLSIIFIEV